MKTIGLLGGMVWPSTLEYYRFINTEVEKTLNNQHSAKCILYSYDFYDINPTLRSKSEILQELTLGIQTLSDAKVDFIVLCSNTMHSYIEDLKTKWRDVDFLDIRNCVGEYLNKQNIKQCLLIGTQFTVQQSFYTSYLKKNTIPPLYTLLITLNLLLQK